MGNPTFSIGNGRSSQALHTLLELQANQDAILELVTRQGQLIAILNAIVFSATHPETVRNVMATREAVSNGSLELESASS